MTLSCYFPKSICTLCHWNVARLCGVRLCVSSANRKCSDFFIRAGKTLQMYNSILKGLKLKKDILATYRKRAINARFLSLADNNKNINVGQEEWILQLPVCKVADTRLANVLYNQDVRMVKDLLEIVSGRGYHLLSKLQMIGVVDESLDRILAGHSIGRFEKK